VGQHLDAAPLDLGRLGVLVLVDHVLVHRQVHELVDLVLLPGLAERGEVLSGVPVEEQLVGDGLEGILPAHLIRREEMRRQSGQEVLAGVDRVEELVAQGFVLVEGHEWIVGTAAADRS
jgi:hypothetical protein